MKAEAPKYMHQLKDHNLEAPNAIVPYLINKIKPASVADIGCGTGTFLHVFFNYGITDIAGVDGSWVDRSKLFIDQKFFVEANLENKISLGRSFDLVLCLEVAEHLGPEYADTLVESLTTLGKTIVFSAAVKNQGGQNHVNEQHFEYWIKKFKARDYIFYDVLRNYFWNDPAINWWYKQNMFLVAHQSVAVSSWFTLPDARQPVCEYIHPELLQEIRNAPPKKAEQKLAKILDGNADLSLYLRMLIRKMKQKLWKQTMLI